MNKLLRGSGNSKKNKLNTSNKNNSTYQIKTSNTIVIIQKDNNNSDEIEEKEQTTVLEILPVEIIENILKHLNQYDLSRCCRVSRSWNRIIYALWHTIDLSKSHHHFTHFSSKLKSELNRIKKNKIGYLRAIFQNLVSNNGFLIPPISSQDLNNSNSNNNSNNNNSLIESNNGSNNNSNCPPLFQKNIQQQQSSAKRIQNEIQLKIDKRMENFFQSLCIRHCRVEVLDLSGCSDLSFDSLQLMVCSFSQTLLKLMTRRCKSTSITDYAYASLFPNLTKLTTLALGEMPLVGPLTMASAISYCPNLTALGLGQCINITDQAIELLSQSSQRKNLHTIGLNNLSHLGDNCIRALGTSSPNLVIFSVSNLRNLTSDTLSSIFLNCSGKMGSIDLSGCMDADDSVLLSIAKTCYNSLFQFNISRITKITSYSINILIKKCKNLKILLLSKTMVDDDCVQSIIDNLPNIEILCAPGCTGITDTSVQSFLNLGPEKLSKMFINFSQCLHISQSLISILQSLTKSSIFNNIEVNNNGSNNNNNNSNNNNNLGNNSGNLNYQNNNNNNNNNINNSGDSMSFINLNSHSFTSTNSFLGSGGLSNISTNLIEQEDIS